MHAIAPENKVHPVGAHFTAGDKLVKRIVNTLKWSTSVPDENVQETIPNGRVTLGAKLRGAVKPTWLSDSAVMQYSPSHSMNSVAGLRFHFFSVRSREGIRRDYGKRWRRNRNHRTAG